MGEVVEGASKNELNGFETKETMSAFEGLGLASQGVLM